MLTSAHRLQSAPLRLFIVYLKWLLNAVKFGNTQWGDNTTSNCINYNNYNFLWQDVRL